MRDTGLSVLPGIGLFEQLLRRAKQAVRYLRESLSERRRVPLDGRVRRLRRNGAALLFGEHLQRGWPVVYAGRGPTRPERLRALRRRRSANLSGLGPVLFGVLLQFCNRALRSFRSAGPTREHRVPRRNLRPMRLGRRAVLRRQYMSR